MTGETTRPVPVTIGEDGVPVAHTITSPTDNTVRAQCKAPPHTVVPIVFVPGIMGSNLRNKHDKKSVWNMNSEGALFAQWAFRGASARQKKLHYSDCELDDTGAFPGVSATVPTAAVANKRGWGGPSKFSYGGFLRWLDDRLNSDLCGSAVPGEDKSPWSEDEGNAGLGGAWGAQKPFQPITKEESNNAWNHFFCPVHAAGYNWLQSNGESGKQLAQKIVDIIKVWNEFEISGHKPYKCEKVILVSHSMGGLVTRAAVHPSFGGKAVPDIANKVLGIVHGELPANGAAAAYHHCRSGYDGVASMVLGNNAAKVTAVFANSPGAMELLPNHQYPAGWLQAKFGSRAALAMPVVGGDPYTHVYLEKVRWWRLIDPALVDPAGLYAKQDPWMQSYVPSLHSTRQFHYTLGKYYHPQTYIHYGADIESHVVWNQLAWGNPAEYGNIPRDLKDWTEFSGSNPVTLRYSFFARVDMTIQSPSKMYPRLQPGDGTVPACSGEAPLTQGGGSVKQSFRLDGFDHQGAYDNERVRQVTFYSICKLLQLAREL